MSYFVVFMSSVFIYNIRNYKSKEKALNKKVCPNF